MGKVVLVSAAVVAQPTPVDVEPVENKQPKAEQPKAEVKPVEQAAAPVAEVTAEEPVTEQVVAQPSTETTQTATETKQTTETTKAEQAAVAETASVDKPVQAVLAKTHTTAPMAKAAGPQELKEIEIIAAPFRTERFQAKGAGSQAASNSASAGMTKPAS
jgi:ribonuclease E